MSLENWRPVHGYEGFYEVSDEGNVRSLRRNRRLLKPTLATQSYNCRLKVMLSKDGQARNFYIHTLVLEAFVGPRPAGMECRHLNDDSLDNRIQNLTWGSRVENLYDRVRNGIHHNARKTHCKRGHEFTAENTYVTRPGTRTCRTCMRLRVKGEAGALAD